VSAGVVQAATINTIGAMGFLNLGTMLGLTGHQGPAAAAVGLGAVFGVLVWRGFARVARLDEFEKQIKS
jgi:hypothetical protein